MPDATSSDDTPSRRKIVRDVLIFELKLWLEGFKDVALMPLSLGAAVIDLLLPNKVGRGALYSVMKLGDRFERWVDLYAALEERQSADPKQPHTDSLDDLLREAADGLEKKASDGRPRSTDINRTQN